MRASVSLLHLTATTSLFVALAALPSAEGRPVTVARSRVVLADAGAVTRAGGGMGAARARRPQVVIAGLAAPANFPGLGQELARSLRSVLSDAGVDARVATPDGASGRSETEHALAGRIEDLGSGRLRLTLSWHGHNVQAMGDVEHLDDMAYAACEQLRPRLAMDAPTLEPPAPAEPVAEPTLPASSVAVALVPKEAKSPAISPSPSSEVRKRPTPRPAVGPATPASVAVVPAVATQSVKEKAKEPEPPSRPAAPSPAPLASQPAPAVPPPAAPVESSPPPPQPAALRPRIAVHIVGEPMAGLPPAFYGAGAIAQQTAMAYLQNRLRYPTVGSRLTGLVGGLDALSQSLRLGARHTLMARFDTLVDGFGSFGTRTVSGRLHIVLLLDGRPLLDRSLSIPPSAYYPTEPATQVIARIVTAALDAISGELAARLGTPPPPQ